MSRFVNYATEVCQTILLGLVFGSFVMVRILFLNSVSYVACTSIPVIGIAVYKENVVLPS